MDSRQKTPKGGLDFRAKCLRGIFIMHVLQLPLEV